MTVVVGFWGFSSKEVICPSIFMWTSLYFLVCSSRPTS